MWNSSAETRRTRGRIARTIAVSAWIYLSAFGSAQNPNAAATPYVEVQYFNNNGRPCAGCLLWTYAAGTSTPQLTYTDKTAGTPNTDPVVFDSAGRADIYIGVAPYKFVLENPPLPAQTHGTQIWSRDGIEDPGLIALSAGAGTLLTSNINYDTPLISGSVSINLTTYLMSQALDIRSFGATGVVGSCHTSSIDNQSAIQAALNYAAAYGPAEVYIPPGYCWPIQTHLWIPPGVHLFGSGRTFGSETSSAGSLISANALWASVNTTFPYSQMIWITGVNATSGAYQASGGNFGSVVDNLEINCNDQVGCGNVFAVGRQEKSRMHDMLLTGGVAFIGGYSYGFFEQGVDCGGGGANTPPGNGCLIAQNPGFSGNAFSGQQGPDERIEIFPSYTTPSSGFIPWALMGANNYKGLRDSTLNGINAGTYAIPYSMYFWGEETTLGPGLHTEGTIGNKSLYIGNVPAGSTCNGGSQDLFTGFDTVITIANCGAQQNLTFVNDAGGVTNNQTGAPTVNVTDTNYFYDQATQTSGIPGTKSPTYLTQSIIFQDPAEIVHTGYNGLNFYNGNTHSGLNAQPLLDSNSVNSRAFLSSNAYWNHGTGLFNLGGNGGTDYGMVLFANGGTCLSNATGVAATFSMATALTNCVTVASQAGHLLVGPGWINTTTGATQGEGSDALQVAGSVTVGATGTLHGGVQFAQSNSTTCPTGATDGATCTFTVPWVTAYAASTYPVICTLLDPTGSPHVKGVVRSTSNVVVTIQNGSAAQAVASGGSGVSCFAGN